MKFRIRLFLWLSSLVASLAFLIVGKWLPDILNRPDAATLTEGLHSSQEVLIQKWRWGLITLGSLLLLSSTMLFLLGKKIKIAVYTGLFILLILISIVAGALVATL